MLSLHLQQRDQVLRGLLPPVAAQPVRGQGVHPPR